MSESKLEFFKDLLELIEKKGLGIVSFAVLMGLFGYQIHIAEKAQERFFRNEELKMEQTKIMEKRLTRLEVILEHVVDINANRKP